MLKGMKAERVAVSWDNDKRKWLVRIEIGSEVIRRHCDLGKSADEEALRKAAQQTVADEGYSVDGTEILVTR